MASEPTVFIVDDDEAVRLFLVGLIESIGLRVEFYASGRDFLDTPMSDPPGCILLDIRMPGMSGLEVQKELNRRECRLPVIILTGHGDVQVAVRAMKAGAVDFVEKPFNNELLLDRIQTAVSESAQADASRERRLAIRIRMEQLTLREREVLELIATGETNKGAARRLNISEKTVEVHRARVMEKMQAKSLASLVRMVAKLETS